MLITLRDFDIQDKDSNGELLTPKLYLEKCLTDQVILKNT